MSHFNKELKKKKSIARYLFVDGGYDGGPDVHTADEAAVEILVENERLGEGDQVHESGQHVPSPHVLLFVTRKGNELPARQSMFIYHTIQHGYMVRNNFFIHHNLSGPTN